MTVRWISFFTIKILLFTSLSGFPIQKWDYNLPLNNVSPIGSALGGFNVTNPGDFFLHYSNPALLSQTDSSHLALSSKIRHEGISQLYFYQGDYPANTAGDSKLSYFGLYAENIGFSVVPLVSVNDSKHDEKMNLKRYIDYSLTAYQIAGSDKTNHVSYGFNLKYLTGRLVYLVDSSGFAQENYPGNKFIDSKARGFSLDLGFLSQRGQFTYGLAFYDIISKIYWENHPNRVLKKKIATGMQVGTEDFHIITGTTSNLFSLSNTYYHLGLSQRIYFFGFDKDNSPSIPLRAGVYFQSLSSSEDVTLGLGTGYQVRFLNLDFSYTGNLKNFSDHDVIIALSVGL